MIIDEPVRELHNCVACGSNKLKSVLDLGKQPLANSYKLNKEDFQEEYPLAINRCEECYHVQLTHAVHPELLFGDYLYVSGTTQTGREHFKEFARFACEYIDKQFSRDDISAPNRPRKRRLPSEKKILDVGCNDGTQLDYFKEKGHITTGIDPARNLYPISSANHEVFLDYFQQAFANQMKSENRTFDVITAQNVFAHTADPLEFLLTAKEVMHDDSLLFIQTSQANMIVNNEFDTIYHEHISFFNTQSMDKLCQRAGLYLSGVRLMPIHGTSYVFIITKKEQPRYIDYKIEEERSSGLYNDETYVKYAENCNKVVKDLVDAVSQYTRNEVGWLSVGYGAPAKGMTLLNYSGLKLDFIIDDNPLKQGRFTPGSSIPIYPASKLDEYPDAIIFVPLAWNFYDEIKSKIIAKRNNQYDKFCLYFPNVRVES